MKTENVLEKILEEFVPPENTKEQLQVFLEKGYTNKKEISVNEAIDFVNNQKTKNLKVYFVSSEEGNLHLQSFGMGTCMAAMLNFHDSGDINKNSVAYALNNLKATPERSYIAENKEGYTHFVMEGKLFDGGFWNDNYYTAVVVGNPGDKGSLFKKSRSTVHYDPHTILTKMVSKETRPVFHGKDGITKWFEREYIPR